MNEPKHPDMDRATRIFILTARKPSSESFSAASPRRLRTSNETTTAPCSASWRWRKFSSSTSARSYGSLPPEKALRFLPPTTTNHRKEISP